MQDRLNDNEEIYLITIISGNYDDRERIGLKLFTNTQDIITEDTSLQKFWESILEKIEYKQSSYNLKLENGIEVFVEYLVNKPHLVICGGGHIALPLCELGRILEFKTTVIDER